MTDVPPAKTPAATASGTTAADPFAARDPEDRTLLVKLLATLTGIAEAKLMQMDDSELRCWLDEPLRLGDFVA